MSANSAPIPPSLFASALVDLPLSTLHLKAHELRNSVAHLDYSNEQLVPFTQPPSPDPDCVEAIAENEIVIARMQERIQLLKAEVEKRGASWTEFMSKEELEQLGKDEGDIGLTNGHVESAEQGERHEAWSNGTFQIGRITNGEVVMDGNGATPQPQRSGGRLTDEELRRALEERMQTDMAEVDEEDGMHL